MVRTRRLRRHRRTRRRGESTEIRTARRGIESTSDYENSPIQYIIKTGEWLDAALNDTTDRRFPILAKLREQGITHYVMAPVVFSNRVVNAMSWATDAPGGFTPANGELLRDLVPAFVPVLEATALRRIYGELLATYVGRDPGARIMAGAVQRGDVRRLKAALLLADMRGFSRLTDLLPEERIVELLNAFFDLVVPGGRLELLCKEVGRPLLMTDTFAAGISEPVFEIGHFELRGFRRHQPVYGLGEQDG